MKPQSRMQSNPLISRWSRRSSNLECFLFPPLCASGLVKWLLILGSLTVQVRTWAASDLAHSSEDRQAKPIPHFPSCLQSNRAERNRDNNNKYCRAERNTLASSFSRAKEVLSLSTNSVSRLNKFPFLWHNIWESTETRWTLFTILGSLNTSHFRDNGFQKRLSRFNTLLP